MQKRRHFVRHQLLRRHKTLQRLLVMAGALQRDAEIKLGLSVARIGGDGAGEQFDCSRKIVRLQPRKALGAQRLNCLRIKLSHSRNGRIATRGARCLPGTLDSDEGTAHSHEIEQEFGIKEP